MESGGEKPARWIDAIELAKKKKHEPNSPFHVMARQKSRKKYSPRSEGERSGQRLHKRGYAE